MNVPLSTAQRTALAIVINAPTPMVALGQLRQNINLATALKQLVKLGMVSSEDQPQLTKVGSAAAEEEGVVDNGALSTYGEELLSKLTESENPLGLFQKLLTE